MAEAVALLDLADELLVEVAAQLAPCDIDALQAACHRARALPTDGVWRRLCKQRWAGMPRYRLDAQRERALDVQLPHTSWRHRYIHFERDFRRETIMADELTSLHWSFNFMAQAGGRGRETLAAARFADGMLHVPRFPPLPYWLVRSSPDIKSVTAVMRKLLSGAESDDDDDDDERDAEAPPLPQLLIIANFPAHVVSRLHATGEWLITNDNVTIVSHPEHGEIGYDERGFLTPAPLPQA